MAYTTAAQITAAGDTVDFETAQINAADGSITQVGTTALALTDGTYLVTFTADAANDGGTVTGAALALDGTALTYAESDVAAAPQRIVVNSVLTVTGGTQNLSVVNSTADTLTYTNAALTVVKLA